MTNFWNIVTPLACAVTAIALHVLSLSMGREVPGAIRKLFTGLTLIFGAGFILMGPGHVHLGNAAAIVFMAIATLLVAILVAVYKQQGIPRGAVQFAWIAVGIVVVIWVMGACGAGEARKRPEKARPSLVRPGHEEDSLQREVFPR